MTTFKPSAGAYVDGLRQQLTEVKEAHKAALERGRAEYARRVKAESGLAEALDALRGMIGLVQLIQAREPDLQSNHRFIEAQRVIAKAENPNSETIQSYPSGRWTEKGTV